MVRGRRECDCVRIVVSDHGIVRERRRVEERKRFSCFVKKKGRRGSNISFQVTLLYDCWLTLLTLSVFHYNFLPLLGFSLFGRVCGTCFVVKYFCGFFLPRLGFSFGLERCVKYFCRFFCLFLDLVCLERCVMVCAVGL